MTEPQPPRDPQEPTPVEPTPGPVEPTPVEPTPVEPTPAEPTPAKPTPAPEPTPPSPVQPAVDSFAAEPVVAPPADTTPEVPATLVDEPPAAPTPVQAPPAQAPTPQAPSAPAGSELPPADPVPATSPADSERVGDVVAEQAAPGKRRRSRGWLPITAVGLAVALLTGTTGVLAWQLRQQSLAEQARPEAIAAARDAARLLFSYSHETLEEDFAKGLAVTTGSFREEYSGTTTKVVTPVAQQYKAVVVAEVVEAAVVEAQAGKATLVVFLNQGTTSTRVEGQQVDQSRVRMHLVERDGRWLVEDVDAL